MSSCNNKCKRERVFCDPIEVRPGKPTFDSESKDSWWIKIKKFLGLIKNEHS
jgi:hypothetical protein